VDVRRMRVRPKWIFLDMPSSVEKFIFFADVLDENLLLYVYF